MLVWGILALCALASSASALQLHLTLHPDPNTLVATWTTLAPAAPYALLAYGPEPMLTRLVAVNASSFTYVMDTCPDNTTRSTHIATFPAPQAAATYFAVSTDGGVTWSGIFGPTHAPRAAFPLTLTLFGDMGIDTGATPNAVPQLVADVHDGSLGQFVIHFGDSGYNMDDACGAVGDAFLDAVSSYAATVPVAWGNGNHETGPDFKYSEYVHRLAPGQAALAAASGSSTPRWYSFVIPSVATVFMLDADAWIYPEVRQGGVCVPGRVSVCLSVVDQTCMLCSIVCVCMCVCECECGVCVCTCMYLYLSAREPAHSSHPPPL